MGWLPVHERPGGAVDQPAAGLLVDERYLAGNDGEPAVDQRNGQEPVEPGALQPDGHCEGGSSDLGRCVDDDLQCVVGRDDVGRQRVEERGLPGPDTDSGPGTERRLPGNGERRERPEQCEQHAAEGLPCTAQAAGGPVIVRRLVGLRSDEPRLGEAGPHPLRRCLRHARS